MPAKNKELEIGGIAFGLTSGVITTLGLIVGIESATSSKIAVIAAILTVAVADSFSDALGMHLSEESRKDETNKPIWTISIFLFLGKLIFSMLFLIPIALFSLGVAVKISIFVGLLIIIIMASIIARRKGGSVLKQAALQSLLAIGVIIISYFMGHLADRIN
ncbi:MAG: hypothetical protein WCW17_03785 [Patescibacteria group bacterium]